MICAGGAEPIRHLEERGRELGVGMDRHPARGGRAATGPAAASGALHDHEGFGVLGLT
jgi:hypothetical protein